MADEHQRHSAPPPPFPPIPPHGPRKLVRRPEHGHVAGVCQGIAEYFNVDPMIVRIAAVILLVTGPGFFAYLVAWVFVPAADGSMLVGSVKPIPEDKTTQIVGVGLIVLAAMLVFGGWWSPAREWLWPLGLVAAGAWLLLRRSDDDDRPVPPTGPNPAGPTSPWASPVPPPPTTVEPAPEDSTSPPSTEDETAADGDPTDAGLDTPPVGHASAADTGDAPAPASASADAGTGAGGTEPPWSETTSVFAAVPPPAHLGGHRRRRFLGPLVFGALLLWGGIAWLAGVEVRDGLAIGLCIVGGGFVLGAFVGGSRALILPAVLVGAALIATSMIDIPWQGGIGDKTWDVDRVSEVDDRYEVAIGAGELDLSELRVPAGRTERLEAALGIGELTVIVPRGTDLELHARAGAGELDILGREDDGTGVEIDRTVHGSAAHGGLELDLHVGLGRIEVRYAD